MLHYIHNKRAFTTGGYMNITSEEIAKLANVSRSTVSRVINHYPNVPEETRIRVMDVIYYLRIGKIQNILISSMGHPSSRCMNCPVRMLFIQTAYFVYHLRLKPKTKF